MQGEPAPLIAGIGRKLIESLHWRNLEREGDYLESSESSWLESGMSATLTLSPAHMSR